MQPFTVIEQLAFQQIFADILNIKLLFYQLTLYIGESAMNSPLSLKKPQVEVRNYETSILLWDMCNDV
jgi:hypothetical protein